MKGSTQLLEEMERTIERIKAELRSDNKADQQIADINTWCWVLVDQARQLQWAAFMELSDLE